MKKASLIFMSICLLMLCLTFNAADATTKKAKNYDNARASKTIVVRQYPGDIYKSLGKLKSGTAVKVYDGEPAGWDQDDWYGYQMYGWNKIKYKNKWGYVKTHELKFSSPHNWVPRVKERTLKEIKEEYVGKKDKTKLKKLKLDKGDTIGYYQMYIQYNGKGKWYPLVSINCKNGWYHG